MKQPRGILNPTVGSQKFQLVQYMPASELSFFIERYWSVRWDLRDQPPYHSEVLPYPSVNLAIEPDRCGIYGVTRQKFTRLLEGKGWGFGIKFKPGAFYPFVKWPIATLTDKVIDLDAVFGKAGNAYAAAIRAGEEERWVELADDFLRPRLPEQDEHVTLVNQIIDQIIADRTITKVEDVVSQFNLHTRALQRLFHRYVGVSPKWVIKRFRLEDAAAQLIDGVAVDWSGLALDLGYFDQAHFIKEFKASVGKTPADYARNLGKRKG